jgi:hypothetical protein
LTEYENFKETTCRVSLTGLRVDPWCDTADGSVHHVGRAADYPAGVRDDLRAGILAVYVIQVKNV